MALGESWGAQSHGHLIGKQSRLSAQVTDRSRKQSSQHSRSLSYFCSWSICPSWTVQTEGPFLGGAPWEAELALTPYLGRQPLPAVGKGEDRWAQPMRECDSPSFRSSRISRTYYAPSTATCHISFTQGSQPWHCCRPGPTCPVHCGTSGERHPPMRTTA